MSGTNINELSKKIKAAASIIARARSGRQTPDDEKILNSFSYNTDSPPYWSKAADRYLKDLKKQQESKVGFLLDNGMLFDFQNSNSAAPNDLLRGKLFAPIAKGRRKALTRQEVGKSADGQVTFSYTGTQLDQADLDTLLTLFRVLSDASKTGNVTKIVSEDGRHEYSRVFFTRYGFLKEMKRVRNKQTYNWLEDSFLRLTGRLTLDVDGKGKLSGPILGKQGQSENEDLSFVDINQDFMTLFKENQFAFIDMDARLSLKKPFEKWLHGFALSHSGKSFLTAEQLMEMSGSSTNRVRDFMRQTATPAFEKLEEMGVIKIIKINGQLYKWKRSKNAKAKRKNK
jgi:hypothetical protein